MKHLELHNILTDSQHGFRAEISTEMQLIQTIHDISKSLDKNETIIIIIIKVLLQTQYMVHIKKQD